MSSIPEYGKELSPREVEVLNAFCRSGFTAKTVGLMLGISHRTVEVHMSNIVVKLGAENQLHAVLMWDRTSRVAGTASTTQEAYDFVLAACRDAQSIASRYGWALREIAMMDPKGQRADDLGRAARTAREALAPRTPAQDKHQPCGCVLCTCEDDEQCHGCGAKFCDEHAAERTAGVHGAEDRDV